MELVLKTKTTADSRPKKECFFHCEETSTKLQVASSSLSGMRKNMLSFIIKGLCVVWVTWVVSDSLWPHGLQPARLLCPWDSPGKNTGVACHALFQIKRLVSHYSQKEIEHGELRDFSSFLLGNPDTHMRTHTNSEEFNIFLNSIHTPKVKREVHIWLCLTKKKENETLPKTFDSNVPSYHILNPVTTQLAATCISSNSFHLNLSIPQWV